MGFSIVVILAKCIDLRVVFLYKAIRDWAPYWSSYGVPEAEEMAAKTGVYNGRW